MSYVEYKINNQHLKVQKIISEDELRDRIKEMAAQISADYKDESVYLVGILKGAFMFMAELCRHITVTCECSFLGVSSYGNEKTTTGKVKITKDIEEDIEGKNVIIIEDIIDTGVTLNFLKEYMKTRSPKSVRICSLLSKPSCRKVELDIDYVGFEIPNEFVIGFGLDYEQYLRNLPYVASVLISPHPHGPVS